MKRLLTILFFLFNAIVCFSQTTRSSTPGFSPRANQTFVVEDGILSARNGLFVPRYDDTTQANTFILKDTLGAVIFTYDVMKLWVRSGSPKTWVQIGSGEYTDADARAAISLTTTGTSGAATYSSATGVFNIPDYTTTASEGITKVASDFQLGGTVTSDRTITVNNGSFKINKSKNVSADYLFLATDTVSNPDLDANIPFAGFLAKRTLRYPSYSAITYRVGAQFNLNIQIKDSAKITTFGGDFGAANKTTMVLEKMSGYSGRSVFMAGDGATLNEGVPVHLNDLTLQHSTSTTSNYRYAKGYWIGTQSYLLMGTNDTLQKWVGFNSSGGILTGKLDYSFDYVGGYFGTQSATNVTNPWFLYGHSTRSKSLIAGPTGFGDSTIEASALIDASSTTKGVIWPRMTATQRNAISSPATGLMVFDSDSTSYFQYNGSAWQNLYNTGGGGGSGTVNSGTQYRLGYYATTGTAISEAAAITANRALISDANGVPTHSATTATELGYVSGVTSGIQAQLDAKAPASASGNYIQNQISGQQASSNGWISGTFRADGSMSIGVAAAAANALNITATASQTSAVNIRSAASTGASIGLIVRNAANAGNWFVNDDGAQTMNGLLSVNASGRVNVKTTSVVSNEGAITLARTFTSNIGNVRGYRDNTVFAPANAGLAYAAYDARPVTAGSANQDHMVAFQTSMTVGNAGTINNVYGLFDGALSVGATSTVTNRYGAYLADVNITGGGAVTNNYGVYIADLAGGTNRWGVYQQGTNAKNHFGGETLIGSSTDLGAYNLQVTGASIINGDLSLGTAGNKINIATGSNASVGISGAMTAGSITISTTAVTANSIIQLTPVGAGTGQISIGTITAGTSFVINSSDGADTRIVHWTIIN